MQQRILKYPQAIREAIYQEMQADPSVVLMGQGVDDPKGILGTTIDLHKAFGKERVFDTPLAEDGMTGIAVGAALAGLKPIHTHIRMDFLLLAMNQLVNMAAKMHYMFGGQMSVPMVVRSIIGKSWGQGPQHSQSFYPMLMNVPGLKIVSPTTPYDAKGCMISAIRDQNPVMYIEHRHLYYQKGFVPEERYTLPIGKARRLAEGTDVTIVGISQMAIECLRARRLLDAVGISADVIDPIWLNPLDIESIENSVRKTGAVLIVDNAWTACSAGAEIITQILERSNTSKIAMGRMGFAPVPCPTTPSLESHFYPNSRTIAVRVCEMLKPGQRISIPNVEQTIEEVEFRGPF